MLRRKIHVKGKYHYEQDTEFVVSLEEAYVESSPDEPSKIAPRAWLIWATAALFYFYQFILRVSPSVMAEDLMREFMIDASDFGTLSSLFLYGYASVLMVMGLIIDKYGPRLIITLAVITCTVGALLFAYASGIHMAQAGRFLMGAGSSCGFLGALKVGSLWFPRSRFGIVGGMTIALGTIGALFANAPLSRLVHFLGWREAIYSISMFGVVLMVAVWVIVRDRPNVGDVFVPKKRVPMMKGLLSVAKNRQILLIAIYGACMYTVLSAYADSWGVLYLMQKFGVERYMAALCNSMIFIGVAFGGPVFSYYSDRAENRSRPMLIAAIGTLIALAFLLYMPDIPFYGMFVVIFFAGFMSSGKVLSFALACENSSRQLSGTVIAFTNTLCMLFGAILQQVVGKLVEHGWDGKFIDGVPVYTPEAFKYALSVVPICIVISIIFMFFIREADAIEQDE